MEQRSNVCSPRMGELKLTMGGEYVPNHVILLMEQFQVLGLSYILLKKSIKEYWFDTLYVVNFSFHWFYYYKVNQSTNLKSPKKFEKKIMNKHDCIISGKPKVKEAQILDQDYCDNNLNMLRGKLRDPYTVNPKVTKI